MKYVGGMMFSVDATKLAMVLKAKPAWQCGLFNVIGGKIEDGETEIQAMIREFAEETGVQTVESEWEFLTVIDGAFGEVSFFRAFSDKVFDVQTIEEELIQLVDPYDLPKNTIQNVRWLVPLSLDLQTLAPRRFKHIG